MPDCGVGVDREERKHGFGLWQEATENGAVAKALLEDLIRRGLKAEKWYLFILDGSKALSSAVGTTFPKAEIQRWTIFRKRTGPRWIDGFAPPIR